MFASSSVLAINPTLGAKTTYDVLRNFAPVILVGYAPNVLAVHPSLPARTVKELIAVAKARPGTLAFASNGAGTLSHLTAARFHAAGQNRHAARALQERGARRDCRGGRRSAGYLLRLPERLDPDTGGQVAGPGRHHREAHCRGAGASYDSQAALPGFESTQWWGFYAPAGTPAESSPGSIAK